MKKSMNGIRKIVSALLVALFVTGCGSAADAPSSGGDTTDQAQTNAGIRLVSADEGAAIQADPPADLVILDVRTLEEFDEGHLEGAEMIDFYQDDFAEQLEGLDRDVPYLLYCRSGNRSGQTAVMMEDLGFTDVADVDGGVVAWGESNLPLVSN